MFTHGATMRWNYTIHFSSIGKEYPDEVLLPEGAREPNMHMKL